MSYSIQKLCENFFPMEKYDSNDHRLNLISTLHDYFAENPQGIAFMSTINLMISRTIYLDMQDTASKLPFTELEMAVMTNPVDFCSSFGLALSLVANEKYPYQDTLTLIRTAFYNLSQEISFGEVKADRVGRLVSITGSVVRVSPSRPLVIRGHFKCFKCNQITLQCFEDGIYQPPLQCSTPRCYNKLLEFDRNSAILSDYQRIKISESHTTDQEDRIPRVLEMEVRGGSLVNTVMPGDNLRIVGMVKTVQMELSRSQRWGNKGGGAGGAGGGGMRQESGLHELYLLAMSIQAIRSSNNNNNNSNNDQHAASDGGYSSTAAGRSKGKVLGDISEYQLRHQQQQQQSSSSYSKLELMKIREIALCGRRNILPLLIYSLCPIIYGQELVKMGLLLGLFGGSALPSPSSTEEDTGRAGEEREGHGQATRRDQCNQEQQQQQQQQQQASSSSSTTFIKHENDFRIRTNIHLLMIGDAGLGKSQLLRACAAVAPRAVLVGASTATTAGLTAAVSRDGNGGGGGGGSDGSLHGSNGSEFCIEAGALVLADGGICCIDELDKASCDPQALLEAMEQQCISIAKGGVIATLQARTSIFAAANPAQGAYNQQKSILANIKMNKALLSRFDLVFLMVDRPDLEMDHRIGEHIAHYYDQHQLQHNREQDEGQDEVEEEDGESREAEEEEAEGEEEEYQSLLHHERSLFQYLHKQLQKLEMKHTSSLQAGNSKKHSLTMIEPYLLRRYIEYAREYVHPILTPGAAKVLQRMYLQLRSDYASLADVAPVYRGNSSSDEMIPVTLRHLESMIRLAQARARCELRTEVTEEDAEEVVQLLTEALMDNQRSDTNQTGHGMTVGGLSLSILGNNSNGKKRKLVIGKQLQVLAQTMMKEANGAVRGGNMLFQRKEILELAKRMGIEQEGEELIERMRSENLLLKKGPQLFQLQV